MFEHLSTEELAAIVRKDPMAGEGSYYVAWQRRNGFDPADLGDWHSQYIAELISVIGPVKGMRVLDVGAGMGVAMRAFQDAGADVWGVDILRFNVMRTPLFKHTGGQQDRLIVGDAARLCPPFDSESFGFVHCSQVVEHIPEARIPSAFEQMLRVARCSARCLITTVESKSDQHTDDEPSHVSLRMEHEWRDYASDAGWEFDDEARDRYILTDMARQYQWTVLMLRKPG